MLKRLFICCIIGCYVLTPLFAQSDWLEWNEDITASEELEDWREKYEELSEIAEHPYHYQGRTGAASVSIGQDDRKHLVLYL